ncbi:MAG: cyclase family protein [Dehalococcoidia bacterium]
MTSEVLDEHAVRDIYSRISNWGRWGVEDQRGTLNTITPAHRVRAATLVRTGVSVGCASALDTVPSPMNTLPAQHYMVTAGDHMPAHGPGVAYDFVGVFPHGQAQSHIDALCHISHDGKLYNDRPRSEVTSRGARAHSIVAMSDGIISRGIFLDIAAARGVEFIEPNDPIQPADFVAAERLAGVSAEPGDIVIYRTGRHERRARSGPHAERLPDGRGHLPGLDPRALCWLREHDIAVIGSDCAHDALPSSFKNEWIPIHVGTEVYLGLPLLHNLQLERLAAACKEHERYEFFFSIAPLNIEGGTASPINPVAIF